MHDGSGKAKKLPLACREVITPLPDHLVQSVLQLADTGLGVDVTGGLHYFFVGNVLLAQ